MLKRMYDRIGKKVHSPHAPLLLGVLFFIEAIFFVPVDPLLILFCLEKRDRALYYATVATVASVLGGILGYFIGYMVWDSLGQLMIETFSTPEKFEELAASYKQYQNWAVLFAGFTPFPYKIVTLTAGFCKLPLLPFIACSFIARGARFYLLAFVIKTWGVKMKEYIDRYFNTLVLLGGLIFVLLLWLFR